MSKQELPILGKPIFIITQNSMSEKVQIANDGYLNELIYFAVNGVKVMALEYADGTTEKVIINKGMKESQEPDAKSLQFLFDPNKEPEDSYGIFVDEAAAQRIAERMNKTQKGKCKKMLDELTKCFHEYDGVIALCTPGIPGKK